MAEAGTHHAASVRKNRNHAQEAFAGNSAIPDSMTDMSREFTKNRLVRKGLNGKAEPELHRKKALRMLSSATGPRPRAHFP